VTPWIDWKGGECPVAYDAVTQIKTRGGRTATGEAMNFSWDHFCDWADIIAYRVIDQGVRG
jgi:hypothetical protein